MNNVVISKEWRGKAEPLRLPRWARSEYRAVSDTQMKMMSSE